MRPRRAPNAAAQGASLSTPPVSALPCGEMLRARNIRAWAVRWATRKAKLLPIVTVGPSRPTGYPDMFASIVAHCLTTKFVHVKKPGKELPFNQPLFSGAPELPALGAKRKIRLMQHVARVMQIPMNVKAPQNTP